MRMMTYDSYCVSMFSSVRVLHRVRTAPHFLLWRVTYTL